MKRLLFTIAFALAVSAQAQILISNLVDLRARYNDTNGVLQSVSVNGNAKEGRGFDMALGLVYLSAGTNPPSMSEAVKSVLNAYAMTPWKSMAEADEARTNYITTFIANYPALKAAGVLTAQQDSDFKSVAKAANVLNFYATNNIVP